MSSDKRELPKQSQERIVHANGVDLCVETFGDPADPPILLIGNTMLRPLARSPPRHW